MGTMTALGAAGLAAMLTNQPASIAYVGTWGENVGYYSTIVVRDVLTAIRAQAEQTEHGRWPGRWHAAVVVRTVRDIFMEFGAAEVLDSFLTRPLLMGLSTQVLEHPYGGVLLGKLFADAVFYGPVLAAREWKLRRTAPARDAWTGT